MRYSPIQIGSIQVPVPIFQGGMGIGVSCPALAGVTAREGGTGTLSSAAALHVALHQTGSGISQYDAVYQEIQNAQEISMGSGAIAINIMHYLQRDFEISVRAAVAADVDMIVVGAGLPITLPDIVGNAEVALIPIVSSLRALKIIHKKWQKKGRHIDAVIVEGPLAGGHLGFNYGDIGKEEFSLEKIFYPIKEFAQRTGDFPVIVAGGVYTHEDFITWLSRGADGVQLGTRFLATEESGATESYKNAVVKCTKEDIIITHRDHRTPGSPSGMPFRTLKHAPMILHSHNRKPLCTKGVVLQKNHKTNRFDLCGAKDSPDKNFCICNGLLASCGCGDNEEYELYTVGANAYRVTEVIPVKKLMQELGRGN